MLDRDLLTEMSAAYLQGHDPRDPLAYSAVMLLLASAAVVAILIPARRAAAADPLQSLRQE